MADHSLRTSGGIAVKSLSDFLFRYFGCSWCPEVNTVTLRMSYSGHRVRAFVIKNLVRDDTPMLIPKFSTLGKGRSHPMRCLVGAQELE